MKTYSWENAAHGQLGLTIYSWRLWALIICLSDPACDALISFVDKALEWIESLTLVKESKDQETSAKFADLKASHLIRTIGKDACSVEPVCQCIDNKTTTVTTTSKRLQHRKPRGISVPSQRRSKKSGSTMKKASGYKRLHKTGSAHVKQNLHRRVVPALYTFRYLMCVHQLCRHIKGAGRWLNHAQMRSHHPSGRSSISLALRVAILFAPLKENYGSSVSCPTLVFARACGDLNDS